MTQAEFTTPYVAHMPAVPASSVAAWSGRVLSGVVIAFMLFDSAIKLPPMYVVTETMGQLGFFATPELARGLGILGLVCTLLYAWPRTAIIGAILLTGYFGGAMATHLRADSPLFSHLLFGFYLGLMTWGGLFLRDMRVRALLFPFASK
jgi:DoxX-like protein